MGRFGGQACSNGRVQVRSSRQRRAVAVAQGFIATRRRDVKRRRGREDHISTAAFQLASEAAVPSLRFALDQ